MAYFAFGETFVEEHKNSHNSPYKFNGKELDEETGNYYYGARYYNPRTSIWLSVDPLAEKFPHQSPFTFSNNNPIIFIDPDGRASIPFDWYMNNKTGDVMWRDGSAKIAGYTNIGASTNLIGGSVNNQYQLNSNGTFTDLTTNQTSGNNESIVYSPATGSTLTSKQNWIQRNFVAEAELKGSAGLQAGVKTPLGKIQGGAMTAEYGSLSFDFTDLDFDANWGDGRVHNFLGGGIGIGKVKGNSLLGVGTSVDYSFELNDISNTGELDWGGFSFGKSFGPGVKNLPFNPGTRTSAKLKTKPDDCYCLDIGAGFKFLLGVDFNLKIGVKK